MRRQTIGGAIIAVIAIVGFMYAGVEFYVGSIWISYRDCVLSTLDAILAFCVWRWPDDPDKTHGGGHQ